MEFCGTSFKFWLCPWNTLKKKFHSVSFLLKTLEWRLFLKIFVNLCVYKPFTWVHVARPTSYLSKNFLYENPPVRHTYWTCFMISSNPFSHLLWLNFEYWITCQVCRFTCKSATVYVLYNFSIVLADWYFSFWRKEFSTRAFVCVLERTKI